jgi:DNA polymerase I
MYPSLIISKNICFTTLSKDGEIVSPDNVTRYMSKERKVGLLPEILGDLLRERDDIRKRMRGASEEERH